MEEINGDSINKSQGSSKVNLTMSSAEATLAGIKLDRMLRKGQHKQAANQTIFEQFYGLAA